MKNVNVLTSEVIRTAVVFTTASEHKGDYLSLCLCRTNALVKPDIFPTGEVPLRKRGLFQVVITAVKLVILFSFQPKFGQKLTISYKTIGCQVIKLFKAWGFEVVTAIDDVPINYRIFIHTTVKAKISWAEI